MNDHLPSRVACRPHSRAGTGLFAKEAISAGEEIFSIKSPLAVVLDSPRLQDTCAYCCTITSQGQNESGASHQESDGSLTPAEEIARELKGCMGCKVVKYCSKVQAAPFSSSFLLLLNAAPIRACKDGISF